MTADPARCTMGRVETVAMASLPERSLRTYYDDLMAPAFPPAELITYDELREALAGGGTHGQVVLDGSTPVAGLVTEDYLDGRVLLLAYVAVAAGQRGRGVGADLIGRVTGGEQRLVLAEVEDPRFHSADEHTGDPAARLRFYERLGSRLLPLPYTQPSLRPGSPRVANLLLITIPSAVPAADEVDGGLVADFLEEYYLACEGREVVAADEEYLALRRATGAPGPLPLFPLTDLGPARPAPGSG